MLEKDKEYRIYKSRVNNEFENKNIFKINQNPEIQSSSPAYLGRIPYNHDR